MKLYKDYSKEAYSFLSPWFDFIIIKKKTQYNLDKQTTKISPLSSTNVSKYEFLTGREKDLLEKAATVKGCKYSPLGSELKKQTNITKKTKNSTKE